MNTENRTPEAYFVSDFDTVLRSIEEQNPAA